MQSMTCMNCKQIGHGSRICPLKQAENLNTTGHAISQDLCDLRKRKMDWDADKRKKFPDLFGSSSSEDDIPVEKITQDNSEFFGCEIYSSEDDIPVKSDNPNQVGMPDPSQLNSATLAQRHQTKPYSSKSAEYKANQQWARFCKWWEVLKETGAVSKRDPAILDPEVFDNLSNSDLDKPLNDLMFQIEHLQRAHLISLYIEQLSPTIQDITHLDGGTIKGYVDAIVRKLWAVERTNRKLSSFYGNWSWKLNNEYDILNKTLKDKVTNEDDKFRGQKEKNSFTADSITAKSWKLLIDKTFEKRDSFRAKNDLHNYVKTNASLCVHIHTMFCGCRAQQEISNLIVTDFTDLTPNCIQFKLSGDFKTRKLGANFNFLDREASYIFGKKYCDPFRIFLDHRAPNAIAKFFLYDLPSARFGDKVLLAPAKPIGPKPLSKAVQTEVDSLVKNGSIAAGLYNNTSLRKGLSDILALAHVPPVLVDLAVGHFNSKRGQVSTAFTDTPNLPTYLTLWKQSITRKKIALLLYDHTLTWLHVQNEDDFHQTYKNLFPSDFVQKLNSDLTDSESFHFDEDEILSPIGNQAPAPQTRVPPAQQVQLTDSAEATLFDTDSFPDDLFLSFLTPPELKKQQQPAHNQNFAQTNTATTYSTSLAPIFHIHGGTVNIVLGPGAANNL